MLVLPELAHIHDVFLACSRAGRERFADRLQGRLLLHPVFDPQGIATLVAGSIAGSASLCVDPDISLLREGLRSGLCDFVVSGLDEALRILKIELRRAVAVSVGVASDIESTLAAMAERGVQPDLLSGGTTGDPWSLFLTRGAFGLDLAQAAESSGVLLQWSPAANLLQIMPQIAQLASASLDERRADTPARRRWLSVAGHYLGRSFAGRQCLRMEEAEAAAFIPCLREKFPETALSCNGIRI